MRIRFDSSLQKRKIEMIVRSIHNRCRPMAQIPAVFIRSLYQKEGGIKTLCATCAKFLSSYRDRTVSFSAITCVKFGLVINLVKF